MAGIDSGVLRNGTDVASICLFLPTHALSLLQLVHWHALTRAFMELAVELLYTRVDQACPGDNLGPNIESCDMIHMLL